jgi:preprotein translocase subunit SecD
VLVLLYIAFYYRVSGIIADFALFFNLFFLLSAMAGLHATLTLPGIAGIILTLGMSVDSNVLIFERIREELKSGKTIRASIDAGYKRALVAIIDSHVTTLITAGVLFQFGTGPVKGFAVSLSLGVAISLFTAVVITRVVFDLRKGYQTLSI